MGSTLCSTESIRRALSRKRHGIAACGLAYTFAVIFLFCAACSAFADDWPQFLGPRRDGTSLEQGLLATWPQTGPPVVWKIDVGEGYSGTVIADGKLILFHRQKNQDVVECRHAVTGTKIWDKSYATDYQDNLGKGNGPRSTPVIADGRVYTLGAQGVLQCLSLKDGEKIWSKELLKEYKVPESYFGIGTSPLVVGKLVLVNVGDKKAGIVAFNAENGKEVWKATTDGASYSSPILATLNGKQRAVFFTRFGVAIINPDNGDVIHHQKWRARYDASVNAATPLAIGKLLFFSASYETGGLLLKADNDKITEVWNNEENMANHFNTCVHYDGHLYGIHGRQESKPALRCIELQTGKVKWTEEKFGCATMIVAEGRIIALTEAGELCLLQPTPQKYQELAKATVFQTGPCRAQIALANGLLYGRDQTRLVCWNLKK